MAIMIDPITGQGVQMGGLVNPGGMQNRLAGPGGGLSQIPVDMSGNVLGTNQPPASGVPGAGGKSGPGMFGQIFSPDVSNQMFPGISEQDQQTLQQTGNQLDTNLGAIGGKSSGSAPGLGGKGGLPNGVNPIDAATGDTTMNLPSPNNIPTPPPTMTPQSGTPGRPVPVAPFTPIGPGHSNPGGGGVIQHPSPQVTPTPPMGRPLTGNFQPSWLRGQQPVTNLSPQPVGRPPVIGTINKPNQGIGTINMAKRGAGRGGILR